MVEDQRRALMVEDQRRSQMVEDQRRSQMVEDQRRSQMVEDQRRSQMVEDQRRSQMVEDQRRSQMVEDQRRSQMEVVSSSCCVLSIVTVGLLSPTVFTASRGIVGGGVESGVVQPMVQEEAEATAGPENTTSNVTVEDSAPMPDRGGPWDCAHDEP
ncbi:unnamed protein product [Arctogadus glacialis]